ncbi:Uncharacterised protein [Chlamydia trachomatis]|nr:Uncharacterised protein [Chlamydia trachomatis]
MIFGQSLARRRVVAGNILTDVRAGTLYNTIGKGDASETALKCWYRPSCDGLL